MFPKAMQNLYFLPALQWILSIAYIFIRFALRFLNEDKFIAQRSDLDYDDDRDADHDHDWWKMYTSVRMYAILTNVDIAWIILCPRK